MRETTADTKVSEEGEESAQDAGEEIPLAAHGEDHGEAGCPPAAHGGPWWSRYPPAAHGRDPMTEQVDA